MNRKGQVTILYTFMIAIVVALLAVAFAPTLKQFVVDARSPSSETAVGLDCENSSISDYDKATCVAVDMTLPVIIAIILSLAGVIVAAKVVFQ